MQRHISIIVEGSWQVALNCGPLSPASFLLLRSQLFLRITVRIIRIGTLFLLILLFFAIYDYFLSEKLDDLLDS